MSPEHAERLRDCILKYLNDRGISSYSRDDELIDNEILSDAIMLQIILENSKADS